MVGNDIEHDPNVTIMARFNQISQFLGRSKVLIDLFPIKCSIAMIIGLGIFRNWGDPDRIKTHSRDVIEIILDALERSAAIIMEVCAFVNRFTVSLGKSIG